MPFDFCYFGAIEQFFQIGSNAVIRFDVDGFDTTSGFSMTNNLPNNIEEQLAEGNIFIAAQDLDPTINNIPPQEFGWEIIGTAPNRTLVISVYNVSMFEDSFSFPGACNPLHETMMVVFYETTNIIDIYIQDKHICSHWNDGNGVVGIQNDAGTVAYVPPGRNVLAPNWTATNEAWRFLPSGVSVVSFTWRDALDNQISTSPTLNVCPTVTTTYTAQAVYTDCNGVQVTKRDDVTIFVTPQPDAGIDGNLIICLGDTVTAPQLFGQLGGTPDAGGAWTPALAGAGVYTYTVTATAPCTVVDTSTVTVTNQNPPDISENLTGSTVTLGYDATITVTASDAGVTYEVLLLGSPLVPPVTAIGTGADLDIVIPAAQLTVGNTIYGVRATFTGCTNVLTDTANILVNTPSYMRHGKVFTNKLEQPMKF